MSQAEQHELINRGRVARALAQAPNASAEMTEDERAIAVLAGDLADLAENGLQALGRNAYVERVLDETRAVLESQVHSIKAISHA